MNKWTNIFLAIGILILANLLSKDFFLRFDLTENKQFTLSRATHDILKNLEEPVMVTAYFSSNLPEQYQKGKRDLKEMLVEYSTLSRGMLDFNFVSPNEEVAKEQEAMQKGIQPLLINVREKDQVKQQKAFMGAILEMGERREVLPIIQPGGPMEYNLSTSIKKLAVIEKPFIGFLQGHGEPDLAALERIIAALEILYTVEPVNLDQSGTVPEKYETLVLLAPKDSFPTAHLAALDDFLGRGGKLVAGINTVDGDFSTAQGTAVTTGLESWIRAKGLEIAPSFMIDAQCGSVTVQQQQGFFRFNSQVQFPFLPLASSFADHPATKGLEQVVFPFVSSLSFIGDGSGNRFTPLVKSSEKTGNVQPPVFFDVNRKWGASDFPTSMQVIGGLLEGNLGNTGMQSSMIVFGDGDFPLNGQAPDNVNLLVNCVDFLSDDTGLIDLRTKEVTSRPLEASYMTEESDGLRQTIKLGNFLFPVLLVLLYGVFRNQRNRSIRIKRLQENYS